MMGRSPAVAGKFYPEDPLELEREVAKYMPKRQAKREVYGILSPHAGYVYSGRLAGSLFSLSKIPDTVVIIGPNHTGIGEPVSIASSSPWIMPCGEVKVNGTLAGLIRDEAGFVKECDQAHIYEHAIEVQLPFLRGANSSVSIVPLVIRGDNYYVCEELGKAISKAAAIYGKPVITVASSDMSHYISALAAREKDMAAINKILKIDCRGLFETVTARGISMCGVMPAIAMMESSKNMGAEKGELVGYTNSGEVTGNFDDVVSYAGILIR